MRSLAIQSIAGNKIAYEDLLLQISELLKFFISSSLREKTSNEKVEDLVQEVLINIHTKIGSYRTDLPILPWIFGIAKYRLIDSLRADKRLLKLQVLNQDIEAFFYSHTNRDLSEKCSLVQKVESALSQLSDRQREVLVLAKAEQLSISEIAAHCEMSQSAVKVTIHRALNLIRRKRGDDA